MPALVYGLFSGHGIWWPVNLLAGMVLPGVGSMSVDELEQFHPALLVMGIVIHVVVSLILGLIYGVLMPTLPNIRKPLAWGALLMPLLWTAVSYVALGAVNPASARGSNGPGSWSRSSSSAWWPRSCSCCLKSAAPIRAGFMGGVVGGLLMPIPAFLWSLAAGHGIWYPVNLLAAMAMHYDVEPTAAELEAFHADLVRRRAHDSRDLVARLRPGVRPRAAAAAGDSRAAGLGRPVDAAALDGHELRPDGRRESGAARARRLALVCRLAVCVRHRGGDRRGPLRRSPHSTRREGPRSRGEFVAI